MLFSIPILMNFAYVYVFEYGTINVKLSDQNCNLIDF
jgi:hypothetical protein